MYIEFNPNPKKKRVVDVLDEHMEVVMLLFPKEYKEVIRRISEEG